MQIIALFGAIIPDMNMSHYETVRQALKADAQLCVVTKKRSKEEIMAYYNLGERIFGENHAQELLDKQDLPSDIKWQFIGHLQRNKVKQVIPFVDCIQSLDSLELAEIIDRECAKLNRTVKCLAEFHLAEEDTNKTGMDKTDAAAFFTACANLEHIDLCGIMVMGPHTEDQSEIRRVFNEAHQLYLQLQNQFGAQQVHILSMGMSADYRIALECGSNMVRIGTYLFTD